MEKTAQEIAQIVVYTMKIAEAMAAGEAEAEVELEKEAGFKSAPKYLVKDRMAIRRAAAAGNVDSEHIAEGIFKRNVDVDDVARAVQGLSKKLKKLRAKGYGHQIPNDQNWHREIRDKAGKVTGWIAGWGPRARTVYDKAMGRPRGIPM